MKKFVKLLMLLLAVFMMLSLCGCDMFESNDDLLSPPRAKGELYEVQKALSRVANGELKLKYPTDGLYRSAIISRDLDGNGSNEAIAFFITEEENITMMHLSVVYKQNGEWLASRDMSITASGIERVDFEDFNNDGTLEIIAGWNVYSGVEKQLSVYEFKNGKLTHLLQQKYTDFLSCDLDTDKQKELFLLSLNSAEKTAQAHIYKYGEEGLSLLSGCFSDGNVGSYKTITEQKLLGGRQAIIVDALKGNRILTEVFYMENGALVNPLCDSTSHITTVTERPSVAESFDINKDGTLEIPIMTPMPGYEALSEKDKVYETKWCSYDGKILKIIITTAMNYEDGYYFVIPKRLQEKITVDKDLDAKTRIVYLYDSRAKMRTNELFRVKTFPLESWTAENEQAGWKRLYSDDKKVIAALIGSYNGNEKVTLEELTEMFKIIEGQVEQ